MSIDLEKTLPIIMAILGMVGGGVGLIIETRKQATKERSIAADEQAAVLTFAKDFQTENKLLKQRIVHLESQVERIPLLEAAIRTLQDQLEIIIGGSAYGVEGDYDTFRG